MHLDCLGSVRCMHLDPENREGGGTPAEAALALNPAQHSEPAADTGRESSVFHSVSAPYCPHPWTKQCSVWNFNPGHTSPGRGRTKAAPAFPLVIDGTL